MVDMPEPVMRMVVHPDTNKVLSTVNLKGEPHLIVCGSLMATAPNMIAAAEAYMYRTAENLVHNPVAEILVWKGREAYSLKVKALERVEEGPVFDASDRRCRMDLRSPRDMGRGNWQHDRRAGRLMDFAGGVRLSKWLLGIGAVLAVIGLTATPLGYKVPGIIVLVIGVSLLLIGFSFSRFFRLYDLQTSVMRHKKRE